MLRKLHALYERVCGPLEPARFASIPKYRRPAIHVDKDRADAYYEFLKDTVRSLEESYRVEEQRRLKGRLQSFAAPRGPKQLVLLHSYRIANESRSCYWLAFAFQEAIRDGKSLYETDVIRQAVIVDVPFNPGNVLIRPETLRDKVGELFCPVDIDFNDETLFSRKYFVLADDEERVRSGLPRSFMRLLADESGIFVRAQPFSVFLSRDRELSSDDTLNLVEIGFAAAACK